MLPYFIHSYMAPSPYYRRNAYFFLAFKNQSNTLSSEISIVVRSAISIREIYNDLIINNINIFC